MGFERSILKQFFTHDHGLLDPERYSSKSNFFCPGPLKDGKNDRETTPQ